MRTIEQLQEENAALMAQVEALREQLQTAHDCITCADETGYVQDVGFVDLEQVALDIRHALESTPQHHLREVRAGAGRAGFVACAKFCGLEDTYASKEGIDRAANKHAESTRQGEVE